MSRKTLLMACTIICQHALALRECHTVDGKWPKGEGAVRREYEQMIAVASELARMHDARLPTNTKSAPRESVRSVRQHANGGRRA